MSILLLFKVLEPRVSNQVETSTRIMGNLSLQIGGYLLILQESLAKDFIVHYAPLGSLT